MIKFQYKTDCGFRAENRLVFCVVRVRVRALYKRALNEVIIFYNDLS